MAADQLSEIEEAFARLMMLEFMLEVVMANELAKADPAQSERTKSELVARMAKPYGPLTSDMGVAQKMRAISGRSIEMAERFVEKVGRRESEIRGQISPGP